MAAESSTPNPIVTMTPVPIQNHVQVPINHGEKQEKFNNTEFKRWQ